MSARQPEDVRGKLQCIDQAQIANVAQRNAFVASGHAAQFAASRAKT